MPSSIRTPLRALWASRRHQGRPEAFTEKYYQEICRGELKPVLESLQVLRRQASGIESSISPYPPSMTRRDQSARCVIGSPNELSPDVPVHFTRFHALYLTQDLRAYSGEEPVRGHGRSPWMRAFVSCTSAMSRGMKLRTPIVRAVIRPLIRRLGYSIRENHLKKEPADFCGEKIPGVWDDFGQGSPPLLAPFFGPHLCRLSDPPPAGDGRGGLRQRALPGNHALAWLGLGRDWKLPGQFPRPPMSRGSGGKGPFLRLRGTWLLRTHLPPHDPQCPPPLGDGARGSHALGDHPASLLSPEPSLMSPPGLLFVWNARFFAQAFNGPGERASPSSISGRPWGLLPRHALHLSLIPHLSKPEDFPPSSCFSTCRSHAIYSHGPGRGGPWPSCPPGRTFSPLVPFEPPSALDRLSWRFHWRGLDLLEARDTIYGNVALTKRWEQIDLFENGLRLFSYPDPEAAEEESISPCSSIPLPDPSTSWEGEWEAGVAQALNIRG